MGKKRATAKTYWKDIGDLRLPNSQWRLSRAARWFEKKLGLPKGAVAFVRPTNDEVPPEMTLKALKAEWQGDL